MRQFTYCVHVLLGLLGLYTQTGTPGRWYLIGIHFVSIATTRTISAQSSSLPGCRTIIRCHHVHHTRRLCTDIVGSLRINRDILPLCVRWSMCDPRTYLCTEYAWLLRHRRLWCRIHDVETNALSKTIHVRLRIVKRLFLAAILRECETEHAAVIPIALPRSVGGLIYNPWRHVVFLSLVPQELVQSSETCLVRTPKRVIIFQASCGRV
jgi:hypothetical protein